MAHVEPEKADDNEILKTGSYEYVLITLETHLEYELQNIFSDNGHRFSGLLI